MPTKGSSCVVVNQKAEILLVLREDLRIWALPGGGVEPNETWEQAAVRETLEETGYQIAIKHYVGEYWRPQMSEGQGDLKRVFLAEVIGGNPSAHDKESIDVRWFPVGALPKTLFRFAREHIQDALSRSPTPVSKEQHLPRWMAMALRLALWLRTLRHKIVLTRNNAEEKQ